MLSGESDLFEEHVNHMGRLIVLYWEGSLQEREGKGKRKESE